MWQMLSELGVLLAFIHFAACLCRNPARQSWLPFLLKQPSPSWNPAAATHSPLQVWRRHSRPSSSGEAASRTAMVVDRRQRCVCWGVFRGSLLLTWWTASMHTAERERERSSVRRQMMQREGGRQEQSSSTAKRKGWRHSDTLTSSSTATPPLMFFYNSPVAALFLLSRDNETDSCFHPNAYWAGKLDIFCSG